MLIGLLAVMLTAAGCGTTNVTEESSSKEAFAPSVIIPDPTDASESSQSSTVEEPETSAASSAETEDTEIPPEGMYRSELTNEWISETLQNQRPIAVMVDNETYALPHHGVNQADIVYEMMNSTANGRITRLMAIVKDWGSITKIGSIRSVRPTNFLIAPEYNAIICHDGGPFYIDYYVGLGYTENLSGGFTRDSCGAENRVSPYNEFVTSSDLTKRVTNNNKISKAYTELYPGKHFNFSTKDLKLSDTYYLFKTAEQITLPFPHNKSALTYNAETQTYDYYVYGDAHIDANDNTVTTFKNVILQSCDYMVFDEHGYMKYYVNSETAAEDKARDKTIFGSVKGYGCYTDASNGSGYYITNGEAVPITWYKAADTDITVFKNKQTGEEITLNTGKTYIAIVPSDYWDQLVIK